MSRHRIVRSMNYNEEYDDDDDYPYGHSVEDECISPTDSSQWIYDRAKGQQSMSEFLANNRDIEEEDDDELDAENRGEIRHRRRDSECYQLPELNDTDRARLLSCMEEIRNIVGESVTDKQLVDAVMMHNYDLTKSLDQILNSTKPPTRPIDKEVKTPIEKDLSLSNIDKKLLFNNLSDLVKSRSQQSEISVVPQLSKLSIGDSSPFSNLSDLAKFHLKSGNNAAPKPGGTNFFIPKLFGGNLPEVSSPLSLSPHEISLKKLMTVKSVDKIPKQNDWIIDLKSALILDKSEINPKAPPKTIQEAEHIPYKFIDCDIIVQQPVIDEYCEIDLSAISELNLKNVADKATVFGKVLCRKYRHRNIPTVQHGFVTKHILTPFNFTIPSPDDVVLSHLSKLKR